MRRRGDGNWRAGGFDLSATQPADEKPAKEAKSSLRPGRLQVRGLLQKRGLATLGPRSGEKPANVFRDVAAEVRTTQPAPFDARSLTHARQRDPETNTWQSMGNAAPDPSVREQAGSLVRAFDVAMAAVAGAATKEVQPASQTDARDLSATILSEFCEMQADVAKAFAQRTTLEHDGDARAWARQKKAVATLYCEQKWTDVLSQKLGEAVSNHTAEHGALIDKLRVRRAAMLDRALKLHSDALWQHDKAAAALVEGRADGTKRAAAQAEALQAKDSEIEMLKARVAGLVASRVADAQRIEKRAEAKVEKTRHALEAMKDLFKDMTRDKRDLARVDERDAFQRMKRDLDACTAELEGLRLLRADAVIAKQEVASTGRELKAFKVAAATHAVDLDARADLVNELMMGQAELGHYVATEKMKREEQGTLKDPAGEGKIGDIRPPDVAEEARLLAETQQEASSIFCVGCQKSMDVLEERKRTTDPSKRVRCLGYRALLPPRPAAVVERSHAWAQVCMRTLLIAKLNHDRLHQDEALVTRFPEFVYAWFARQAVVELSAQERSKLVARELGLAKDVREDEAMDPDDEDRWAFYAKVKELAALGSTEANMFWLLLDETHGDDYGCFFLHCFQASVACCGATLGAQLGLAARGFSYHQTCFLAAEADPALTQRGVPGTDTTAYDRADLVKALDSLATSKATAAEAGDEDPANQFGGAVVVYLAQAYGVLDAVLQGPLEGRAPLLKNAVRGLSQPCTSETLACFDERTELPTKESQVWLLFGPPPTNKSMTEHCLKRKVATDTIKRQTDLFSFLQVLVHVFKEEQATRRAAVRVMFGAVADRPSFISLTNDATRAVAKTQDMLQKDRDLAYTKLPRNLTLGFDTFDAMTRALWPKCSQVEAAAMYRDAFDLSHGHVDHATFELIMARHRVFTRALQLPQFEGCGFANALSDAVSTSLTTVVTRRLHFAAPLLERVRAALPQPAAKRFGDLVLGLQHELGAASPTRGVRALATYREVLRRALALRSLKLQVGSAEEFLAGPDARASVRADAELGRMEDCLRLHDPGPGDGTGATVRGIINTYALSGKFLRFRRAVAARKIQATLRRRADKSPGPPPVVLNAMRRLSRCGRGAVHRRRISRDVAWAEARVAQIYAWVRDHPGEAFGASVYRYHLAAWGAPTLADRAVHDLYFNVRRHSFSSKRCLLFAAFSGIHFEETSRMGAKRGSSSLLSDDATGPAARRFFFGCVDLLRAGGAPFPHGDEERWRISQTKVEALARAAFRRDAAPCYALPETEIRRKGRLETAKSFDAMLLQLKELEEENESVEADDVLWLFLAHWRELIMDGHDRTSTKALAATLTGHASVKTEEAREEAKCVAARALLSLDHFALLKRKLGLWGVDDDSTNDVAAYHAAVARFERTPPPSPVQAVVEGLRHGHVRALRGASARAVVDGARARSVVAQDWRQYEDVVRVHVTELTQALKQANARKRRESLQKKDMSEVGELDLDEAAIRVQQLGGLLEKMEAALGLLGGEARDPEDDAAPWSSMGFGYEAGGYVEAFRNVGTDEALGTAARVVQREVRCLLAHVYETQVDAGEAEFVKDE